jgi:hypothetical protein
VTEAAADNPTIAATGRHPAHAETQPGYDWLDLTAFGYLALPVVLFLLGWLQWWVGIPLAALLLAGAGDRLPNASGAGRPRVARWGVVVLVIAAAVGWSSLGGAGHLFFANFDWQTRDLVLRDLVVGAWPVGYGLREGADLGLAVTRARGSPAVLLLVLATAAASALSAPARALQRRVYWPIRLVLLLGVPTAVMEMTRAVQEPVRKPDYSKSLVPDPAARYPAHYVTRLSGSIIEGLLRPMGNVNAAGPEGPGILEEQSK